MRDVSDLSAKIEIVKWEIFCDIAVGSRTPWEPFCNPQMGCVLHFYAWLKKNRFLNLPSVTTRRSLNEMGILDF